MSVRSKITLSSAGLVLLAGALLLAVVWGFLLRHVPDGTINTSAGFVPNRSDLLKVFVPATLWALALLLAFGLLGGWLLAGRMLAPLRRITQVTRTVGEGALTQRIALPGRDDEFRELADAFDSMLGRLEAHIGEQQRFAANASHELRTPLAVSKSVLEIARNEASRSTDTRTNQATLERLAEMNDRAIALTEALLLLSAAGSASFEHAPVDLSLAAEEAGETLLSLAERRSVSVEIAAEPTIVSGSPALLLQLATNLMHNAIVHNRAEGGELWVKVAPHGRESVRLVVENTGAPVSQHVLATLTEPFQRGQARVRTEPGGERFGLGLAIVQSIVRAHSGELEIRSREGGGLIVSVTLPAWIRSS